MKNDVSRVWRVGFVGAGHIARFHADALRRVPQAKLVAVHDCNRDAAALFARQHEEVQVIADYAALVQAVDVVHILTPPASHADLAEQALQAGCHVMIEKPMATTVAECDQIITAARAAGRHVAVDHSLLRDPFTERALAMVARGAIGKIVSMQVARSQDYPEYRGGALPFHARDPAFPFVDLGIHTLYQCEAFLGPLVDLQCSMRRVGTEYGLTFDEWHGQLQCRDGWADFQLSWNARPLQDLLVIHGTQGTIRIDRFGMHVTLKQQGRLPEHPRRAWNALSEAAQIVWQVPWNLLRVATGQIRRYHGLQATVGAFYTDLAADQPPANGPIAARRLAYWMEPIIEEARSHAARQRRAVRRENGARILVTGANGFIGRHLLERLLNEDRCVRVICRSQPPASWTNDRRIDIVLGDLGDPEIVEQAMEGIECVYHLAGVVHGSEAQFWRGNVAATENIVRSCVRHQVRQLIYVSSLSVLQSAGVETTQLDEWATLEKHAERRGAYTQTKLAAEQLVVQAVANQRLAAVIVRPGEVIGAGAPLMSSGVGQRLGQYIIMFGDGELPVPLVHVADVVDLLLRCEARGVVDGTIYHAVDPECVTQNQLVVQYQQLLRQPLTVIHVPRLIIFVMAWLVQSGLAILRRRSPLSIYRLRSALARRQFNCDRARTLLDWEPRHGVLQGLRDSVEAFREQGAEWSDAASGVSCVP